MLFSKKFKLNQEIYSKKSEELVIEDEEEEDKEGNKLFEMSEISTTNSERIDNYQRNDTNQNFLMKEEPDFLLQERYNELDNIVKGVNNLQEMFKDMNVLVNEVVVDQFVEAYKNFYFESMKSENQINY